MSRTEHENLAILWKMYHWPTGKEEEVSVAFPKNTALLQFFKAMLVHKKSFSSTFNQLTDSTPKKNRIVRDRICSGRDTIYAEVLVQSQKYFVNIKKTLK